MNSIKNGIFLFSHGAGSLLRALIVAGFLFGLAPMAEAWVPPGGGTNLATIYTPLDSWSFYDRTNWTSDKGYAPVSFTNLSYSWLGNGSSLVLDSTNPAWLQYNVYETDGTTNLTVDAGSILMWFAPSSWSSTNQGGLGCGEFGRLLEIGGFSPDSSFGWWSIYVDEVGENLYFSAQTNDLSGTVTTYISYPISWTTNYFHHVAVTYSATNTALYLDGNLVTNGPPMTVYPGTDTLTNGVFIGSDSNGVYQAHGMFDSVMTYSVPLDADTIQQMYNGQTMYFHINPWNKTMFTLASAPSTPSFTSSHLDVISGIGDLQLSISNSCGNYTNPYIVWFTNVTATARSNGTMNVKFTIEGGYTSYFYDIFVTGTLQDPLTNSIWFWLGQGQPCNTYTVNVTSPDAFLIMGTPLGTNGLTYAYESLVAKVSPTGSQTDSYGVPYAWYAQNGLVPIMAGIGTNDLDGDGLLNYQEYLYGTRPNVNEGFSIWIGSANGTTVIP